LDTLALLNTKNLGVTSDRQFDKEGIWNVREKKKKKGRTTFLERVGSFY